MSQVSEELLNAYKTTTYSVPGLGLNIRVGEYDKVLQKTLKQHNLTTWAFITAWNPESRQLSLPDNRDRNQALLTQLKSEGFAIYEGIGIPDISDWTPEESLFVMGVSQQRAIELGIKYGQNALIFGQVGKLAELLIPALALKR